MNRKYMFAAAVLSLTITAAAGCGNKPAAENSDTASPQAVPTTEATAEDTSQQVHDDGGGEKMEQIVKEQKTMGRKALCPKTGKQGMMQREITKWKTRN